MHKNQDILIHKDDIFEISDLIEQMYDDYIAYEVLSNLVCKLLFKIRQMSISPNSVHSPILS
mgnify:CR=1 FL=1